MPATEVDLTHYRPFSLRQVHSLRDVVRLQLGSVPIFRKLEGVGVMVSIGPASLLPNLSIASCAVVKIHHNSARKGNSGVAR
jgi:hypothetical protein